MTRPARPRLLRAMCAAAALWLASAEAAAQAPLPRPPALDALLARSAELLARGEARAALQGYEAAASQQHALDIELGITLSLMRAGEYRRALAFAAHTAQAHADRGEGPLLYARMLDAGAQPAVAQRVLDAAAARPDGAARLAAARSALGGSGSTAQAVSSGVLVDGGRHALMPAGALPDGTASLRLRDGRGRDAAARLVRRAGAVALLRLEPALDEVPALAVAERDAFPGAPAYATAYAGTDVAHDWPRLRLGFLGAVRDDGERALGIDLPPGPRGGPVFDAAGRLVGLSTGDAAGRDHLLPVSALREHVGELLALAPAAAAPRVPLDVLYENALRLAVQVFAAP